MKLIKVPEDVDEIINVKDFKKSIIEINKFNNNLEKFGNKILEKWIKSIEEWKEILSKEDWNIAIVRKHEWFEDGKLYSYDDNINYEKIYKSSLFLFDYKNKKLIDFDVDYGSWSMGASTSKNRTIKFSDCGNIIIVKNEWSTKEARFDHIPWITDHIPWITHKEHFYIDYVNGQILEKPYE